MIFLQLFFVFFRIGLFAVGGAYSFLPLIQKDVVERYHWLTREEFLDVLGIVKIFPGAISIKFATYTGYKMAGLPGVMVANAANLLAPVILILIASSLYYRHKQTPFVKNAFDMIQWAVFAMIVAVAAQSVSLGQMMHVRNLLVVAAAFGLYYFLNVHPVFIILAAGLLGICWAPAH